MLCHIQALRMAKVGMVHTWHIWHACQQADFKNVLEVLSDYMFSKWTVPMKLFFLKLKFLYLYQIVCNQILVLKYNDFTDSFELIIDTGAGLLIKQSQCWKWN